MYAHQILPQKTQTSEKQEKEYIYKLNVQLFFKSIFQLKQSNKAQVFDKRMKIYRSMASVNAKKRKKLPKHQNI